MKDMVNSLQEIKHRRVKEVMGIGDNAKVHTASGIGFLWRGFALRVSFGLLSLLFAGGFGGFTQL